MPNYCAAYGCSNSTHKKKGISLHKFPLTDKTVLRRWLVNIRRAHFKPNQYSFLCSDHFTEEDFEYQPFTNRRGLKKGAVPTRFSYNTLHQVKHGDGPQRNRGAHKKTNKRGCEQDISEPMSIDKDIKSNQVIEMDNPTLVEIFMNEKFYPPGHFEALINDLPKASTSKHSSESLDGKIVALKQALHAKILLRTLKKQVLDAQIKSANAKRDYYEAKAAMLPEIQNAADLEDSSDSETESSALQNIKNRLKEEEIAAQIEERMLQEQLEEAQMHATRYEKEYYEAKSNMPFS